MFELISVLDEEKVIDGGVIVFGDDSDIEGEIGGFVVFFLMLEYLLFLVDVVVVIWV